LLNRLKSLLSKGATGSAGGLAELASIAPDEVLLVVGDIHGCDGLLNRKLKDVDRYVEENNPQVGPAPRLIFVGDYIDRGEQSAHVLRWLFELQQAMPDQVTCLMGNHERMMIDFLDDPAGRGVRWLRNGGLQTLASYNIGGVRERSDAEELTEASHALEAAMPKGMIEWIRNLPMIYQSGNICVAHAAMDPHLGPEDQSPRILLWGHNEFMTTPRNDDLWVVHGHTIVREPEIKKSRISIDTGAYHSGRLTVAVITQGSCVFI
jgi:serine/threonine protein phosphatase 1